MAKTPFLLVAGVALVAAACSPSAAEPPPTTTTTTTLAPLPTSPPATTSTLPATTTSTLPPIEVFDTVNGLEPLTDESLGVMAIKIDNHPRARPHTGLQYADIVYELPVEAGLTRFIAFYDRFEVQKVGPVRSLRVTDPAIVNPIDVPLQVSGGSTWILRKVKASGTKLLEDTKNGTYRDNSRRAPHNLYADTEVLRAYVEGRWGNVFPGNLFTFGESEELQKSASRLTIPFSNQPPSIWEWDDVLGKYLHSYAEEPHLSYDADGAEEQVMIDTLIVIMADQYTARPSQPSYGTAVPAMDLVGTGEALVLYDGGIGPAVWTREAVADSITLTNLDGSAVTIEPGYIWVSIVPTTQTVTWE